MSKQFEMTHEIYLGEPTRFSEETAPSWLTSENTVPGSTTDDRWFWKDHVLTLPVGGIVQTDFHTIKRVA